MKDNIATLITEYYGNIKLASKELTKKELFKSLLNNLFGSDKSVINLLKEIDLGSEKAVFNIPLKKRVKTGSADTQYRNIIIEFENDLNKSEEHAKDQLKEYVSGNWKSGVDYDFVLISTDCLIWKVYAPLYEPLLLKDNYIATDVNLEVKETFELTKNNSFDFFYFIDHYLFRTQKLIPTYNEIKKDFGDSSPTFLNSIKSLSDYFLIVKDDSEIEIIYEQWNLFLSIAYGTFKASYDVFLIHTYLSVLSKLIAYFVITKKSYIDDNEIKEILKGTAFNKLNIKNFIENDFYQWISYNNHFEKLKQIFRKIANQIGEYDFNKVEEDILKGLYQNLIDIETRHALGEYYTPDWLCEKIVDELKFKRNSMILDPTCGSGSFLRAAISKLLDKFPDLSISDILSQVVGIDIHPLSVQISKTTILLAISHLLTKSKVPITIQVYLANTLIIPKNIEDLFGDFEIKIHNKKYQLPREIIDDPIFYDDSIQFCEKTAIIDSNNSTESKDQFSKSIKLRFKNRSIKDNIVDSLFHVYLAFKETIENKCDSIWGFILKNSYKPLFLSNKFDFIIGNPPWLPYRNMNNREYQSLLLELAKIYALVPKNESITHLELAAIFISHCSSRFLKKTGELVFVLPRGFLSADHHDNSRNGSAQGFKIERIWDLKDVSPLFKITSCVFFCSKRISSNRPAPHSNIKGQIISGNLPDINNNLETAKDYLSFQQVTWHYSRLGKRSAFSTKHQKFSTSENYYLSRFKQGATIVPRNLYFIELFQEEPQNWKNRIIYVQTDKKIKKDSKKPWDEIELKMRINSQFLFRTALSKNILPFALVDPTLIHLPLIMSNTKEISLLNWNQIKQQGFLESAEWFKEVEKYWDKYKTEKSKNITYLSWLNYQNKLTSQDLNCEYLVIYTASSKDANATLVRRESIKIPFIVESKTYWIGTNKLNEAFYLIAFLNSNFANIRIKDFQSTGLFGFRDIHKKILEIPLPKFDLHNKSHLILSKLSEKCKSIVEEYLNSLGETKEISGIRLGNFRLNIRNILKNELIEIDKLLEKIIK